MRSEVRGFYGIVITAVKAFNFGPHGKFFPFLGLLLSKRVLQKNEWNGSRQIVFGLFTMLRRLVTFFQQ
jgi:hypothetical protein